MGKTIRLKVVTSSGFSFFDIINQKVNGVIVFYFKPMIDTAHSVQKKKRLEG